MSRSYSGIYMMQRIADFLGCCHQETKEPHEITATFQQRVRAHSQPSTRSARITRSLGKNTHNHEPTINHNNTALTLTCTRSSKFKSRPSKDIDSSSSYEHSFREEHSFAHQVGTQPMIPNNLKRQKYEDVINYVGENRGMGRKEEANGVFSELEQREINLEPPQLRTCTPRLLLERRLKQNTKEPSGISLISLPREEVRGISSKKTPFKATILEPIEQRLSMPSCSSSQVRDSRQMAAFSSRTALLSQSGQRLPDPCQQGAKHQSCIFGQQNSQVSPFGIARSESKLDPSLEADQFESGKLRVDVEIYQNELRTLQDEEALLRDQSHYQRDAFLCKLSQLSKLKCETSAKMNRLQKEMKEMKAVIRSRMDEQRREKGT